MTYHGVWDRSELYDMNVDPDQMDNLLGAVPFGQQYGDFLRATQRHDRELHGSVKPLDDQLNRILRETGGRRQPLWSR